MSDNAIILELNTNADGAKRKLDNVAKSLGKVADEALRAIAGLRATSLALNDADAATDGLYQNLSGIAGAFSSVRKGANDASAGIREYAKTTERAAEAVNALVTAQQGIQFRGSQNWTFGNGGFGTTFTPSGIKQLTGGYEQLADSIGDVGEAYGSVEFEVVGTHPLFGNDRLLTGYGSMKSSDFNVFNGGSSTFTAENQMFGGMQSVNAVHKLAGEYKSVENAIKGVTGATKDAAKATGMWKNLLSSIGRIAFYRAIRSAIKAITSAYREGVNNLYQYSAALNSMDALSVKNHMDSLATSALYVKNTLGASLAPIIANLAPLVEHLANAFVAASNAVTQFLAALGGSTTYTKAKRYATEYADAVDGASGAVKELKKQVLGFDELNVLNAPNAGGGSRAADQLDFSQMFEEANIEGAMKRFAERMDALGAKIKLNFKDVLLDWTDVDEESIAKKIESGLFTILGGVTGFVLGGVPGAFIGMLTGFTISLITESLDFDNDGTLSQDEVLNMIKRVGIAMTGAALGWAVGGPKGALMGISVATGLTTIIQAILPEAAQGIAFGGLFLASLIGVLGKTFLGSGIRVGAAGAMGLSSGGSVIGMAALFGLGLTLSSLGSIKNSVGDAPNKIVAGIVEVLNLVAGGLIGFAIGNVPGAVIGITIAAGLNFLINKVDWGLTGQSKRELDDMAYISPTTVTATGKRTSNGFTGKADGGLVPSGTYFYAGESGPELVGQVNGRTRVTNESQFTAGMEGIMDNTNSVIIQCVQRVIEEMRNKETNIIVPISDRDIYNANKRGAALAGASMVK